MARWCLTTLSIMSQSVQKNMVWASAEMNSPTRQMTLSILPVPSRPKVISSLWCDLCHNPIYLPVGLDSSRVPQATGSATGSGPSPSRSLWTSTPSPSNTGTIAGGVVGGLVLLASITGVTIWWVCHLRARRGSAPPGGHVPYESASPLIGPATPLPFMKQAEQPVSRLYVSQLTCSGKQILPLLTSHYSGSLRPTHVPYAIMDCVYGAATTPIQPHLYRWSFSYC